MRRGPAPDGRTRTWTAVNERGKTILNARGVTTGPFGRTPTPTRTRPPDLRDGARGAEPQVERRTTDAWRSDPCRAGRSARCGRCSTRPQRRRRSPPRPPATRAASGGPGSSSLPQGEADTANRLDQPPLPARLELAPQVTDEDVQGVRRQRGVVAPDALVDQPARQAPGAGGEGRTRAARTPSSSARSRARHARRPGSAGRARDRRRTARSLPAPVRRSSARTRATSSSLANGFTR